MSIVFDAMVASALGEDPLLAGAASYGVVKQMYLAARMMVTGDSDATSYGDAVPTELCPIHRGTLKRRAARAGENVLRSLGRKIGGVFH